jgi:hypothetical protein
VTSKSAYYTPDRTYYAGSRYYDTPPASGRVSHFWPMVGAFAAGTFLGTMLHPWGGDYAVAGGGYVHQPFSFMSFFLDILIIVLIIWGVSRLFRRFRHR